MTDKKVNTQQRRPLQLWCHRTNQLMYCITFTVFSMVSETSTNKEKKNAFRDTLTTTVN